MLKGGKKMKINWKEQLIALFCAYFVVSFFMILFPNIPSFLCWIFGGVAGIIILYKESSQKNRNQK